MCELIKSKYCEQNIIMEEAKPSNMTVYTENARFVKIP